MAQARNQPRSAASAIVCLVKVNKNRPSWSEWWNVGKLVSRSMINRLLEIARESPKVKANEHEGVKYLGTQQNAVPRMENQ